MLTHERAGRMRIYRIERKRLALVSDWLAHFQNPVKHGKEGLQNAPPKSK
jgi:hypothetical protein